MPFAAAHSVHPSSAQAIGEITGQVLDQLDDGAPDLAVLFFTAHHLGAVAECAAVVDRVLRPATLIGGSFASVLANAQQSSAEGMTLWAGRFGPVMPVTYERGGSVPVPDFEPTALLLLADPFEFPTATALAALAQRFPGMPIVGGMASAASTPSANRLLVDGGVLANGAVGVLLGPGVDVEAMFSHGSRRVGHTMTVTATAGGGTLTALDGQPATVRLRALIDDELTEEDAVAAHLHGFHVGVHDADGLALVRTVLALDRPPGTITVEGGVEAGSTVQFYVRSPEAADDDLRAALNGRRADSALLFPQADRASIRFLGQHHDALVVDDYLGQIPVGGASVGSVFGASGGHNRLHPDGVSALLLRQR